MEFFTQVVSIWMDIIDDDTITMYFLPWMGDSSY